MLRGMSMHLLKMEAWLLLLPMRHFEAMYQQIKKQVCSQDLLTILRLIWTDVLLIDEVLLLPEASLPDLTVQSAHAAVKDFISNKFTCLLLDISEALKTVQVTENEGMKEEYTLAAAFEASKKAIMQGSVGILQEFRQLLGSDSEVLLNLRDLAINWVEEGFQSFFKKLDLYFQSLSGKSNEGSEDLHVVEQIPGAKISAGLVLVLAHFSLYVEQSAIAQITEEISSFSGGGVRGFDHGPAFVPAEICRIFRLSRETFLNLYIKMRTQKISVLLKKRFTAPNWAKHKEPREVHMFVDLLLLEFEEIRTEVKQILPHGPHHKHRRTDSNGSTASSRSNPLREDRLHRSNTQKSISQLLETHLAKLFKQKMEIFTKIEHTQESVLTTIVRLPLKSLFGSRLSIAVASNKFNWTFTF